MCGRLGYPALLSLLVGVLWVAPARAQLIEGVAQWADSAVGLSTTKWAGPRVPYPMPEARPATSQALDSIDWPVRVQAGSEVPSARLVAVLRAAELTQSFLRNAGFLTSFGDAGQGGSGARDLYLVQQPGVVASALDASANFSALDGARAYALLDARTPSDRVLACTAQALVDAQLLELDPAEDARVRAASASYFAGVIAGETCNDASDDAHDNPFLLGDASGAAWLARLEHRQDRGRGLFLFDMWQFARQRTWEGHDLRASPDLFEAIAKALDLAREELALVVGELAEERARAEPTLIRNTQWSQLPYFSAKAEPPLGVLGSKHVLLQLPGAQAGARLRAWSRGESGGRYVISALKLDARGKVLARYELAPRRDPTSQLSIELDADTRAVLVTVTRYADEGIPDPDTFALDDVRPVSVTIDTQT